MDTARRGRFSADTAQNRMMAQKLLSEGVPKWYVESMQTVLYLFPKAHAVQYTKTAAALTWFKIYYPKAFSKIRPMDGSSVKIVSNSEYVNFPETKSTIRCITLNLSSNSSLSV